MEKVKKLLGNGLDSTWDTGVGMERKEARGLAREGQAKEDSGFDDTRGVWPEAHDYGSHEGDKDELSREEYGIRTSLRFYLESQPKVQPPSLGALYLYASHLSNLASSLATGLPAFPSPAEAAALYHGSSLIGASLRTRRPGAFFIFLPRSQITDSEILCRSS